MYSQSNDTQVTFHYENGHSDAFSIPLPPEEFQQQIQLLLDRPWITLHLFDETVFICTSKLTKVEIKPAVPQLKGVGVFANCERVTALSRTGR